LLLIVPVGVTALQRDPIPKSPKLHHIKLYQDEI